MSGRPAAFLDRDGTIIRDAAYIRDPAQVELMPGAADAIRRLNERGIPVIVVTNQSGIARGLLTTDDYEAVQRRMRDLLSQQDAHIDASYVCPHHPDFSGPCDCRKPGLALYREAIDAHAIEPTRSLFTGDRMRDVSPASALSGRGIMIDTESTTDDDREQARAKGIATASSLAEAVDQYLAALPA